MPPLLGVSFLLSRLFVFFYSSLFCASVAPAQDFLIEQGQPGKQNYVFALKSAEDLSHSDDAKSRGQSTKLIEGSAFLPVIQTEDSTYGLTARAHKLALRGIKSTANIIVPENLYEAQYGVRWAYQDADANAWGAGASVGTASDKPFEGSDVTIVNALVTRKIKADENSSWIYLLAYSNNRSFLNNIPLPGFAYLFMEPNKSSGGAVGVPFFSYWWRPTPKFSASTFYIFPSVVRAQAGYMLWGPLQGNLKFEQAQQTYLRSGRADRNERLFLDSKKAAVSLKSFFGRQTHVELELAKVFDRSLFNGKDVFKLSSDRFELPDDLQVSLAAQLSY